MNSPAMAARACGGRLLGLELSGAASTRKGSGAAVEGSLEPMGVLSVVIGGAEVRHRQQEVAGKNSVKSP
jgi:hypothetical protein